MLSAGVIFTVCMLLWSGTITTNLAQFYFLAWDLVHRYPPCHTIVVWSCVLVLNTHRSGVADCVLWSVWQCTRRIVYQSLQIMHLLCFGYKCSRRQKAPYPQGGPCCPSSNCDTGVVLPVWHLSRWPGRQWFHKSLKSFGQMLLAFVSSILYPVPKVQVYFYNSILVSIPIVFQCVTDV